MFKSEYIGGQKEKFMRLDSSPSTASTSSTGMKRLRFNFDSIHLPIPGRKRKNASKSFRMGVKRGSDGLMSIGRTLRSVDNWKVFPEDLKVSEKKVFDPQDKNLLYWNKFFEILCIVSIACDPLFFYLPYFNHKSYCLAIDDKLAGTAIVLRTICDAIYLIRIAFQFRTAFIAPSSRVFGRGELVIDPKEIAKKYLRQSFIIDFLSILPFPQIIVMNYHQKRAAGVLDVFGTKKKLLRYVIWQYLPRFMRFIPLASQVKKTAGVFSENALLGAMYYLIWYMLASHITGSVWYLLSVERNDTCWQKACKEYPGCNTHFLYCSNENKRFRGFAAWEKVRKSTLQSKCSLESDNIDFDYGIYSQAISSNIVSSIEVFPKFCYCLWWGLQNLSTLGQGLLTSTYPGEVMFSIVIAIMGLVLFALLIGNMQTYLQSMSIRLDEMRIKRRDSEQWMHHRLLPIELREKVRRYDQYKWLNTRGVDEENLVQKLPKDLRRDIKRHLCLNLVRGVPLFANMDERLLDAICERLKPSLYTEETYLVREGDPVGEMLFIIRGQLESVTTDGGRSGFFNKGDLKEGDFCGEELLTWALDPKSASNYPSSTRTVKAMTEVEAFALEAEELKFVASQFRHIHSRQVQHTFRFYSQQWRTWAATYIQAAWRKHLKRKRRKEQEEEEDEYEDDDESRESRESRESEEDDDDGGDSARALLAPRASAFALGSTFYASRFAANALRGHRLRVSGSRNIPIIQKPPEPDFSLLHNED